MTNETKTPVCRGAMRHTRREKRPQESAVCGCGGRVLHYKFLPFTYIYEYLPSPIHSTIVLGPHMRHASMRVYERVECLRFVIVIVSQHKHAWRTSVERVCNVYLFSCFFLLCWLFRACVLPSLSFVSYRVISLSVCLCVVREGFSLAQ